MSINIESTKEDQGYADDAIRVMAHRQKLADPPKVAFVANEFGRLSSFYIAYQPKDSSAPLKNTPVITIGGNDGRESNPTWFRPLIDIYTASAQPWDFMKPDLSKFPQMPLKN